MITAIQTDDASKLLLTASQAAAALQVCEKTLWSMTRPRGSIPVVRIGRRTLYSRTALQRWIDSQSRADIVETELQSEVS